MTTIRAPFAKAIRPVATIIAFAGASVPAAAQPSLSPGTPVRITLLSKQFIEGSLVSADTNSITVRVNADDIGIPRRQIATMAVSTGTRATRYGLIFGLVTAPIGAWLVADFGKAICESDSCRHDAATTGAAGGAGVGFLVGALAGGLVGALYDDWESLPASVDVGGRAGSTSAREACPSNPAVDVHGSLGLARGGGTGRTGGKPTMGRSPTAVRIGVTLLCRTSFSVGPEGGSLGGELSGSWSETAEGPTRTSVATTIDRSSAFQGGFVQIPLQGPLNPRLIASAGSYSRTETITTSTNTWNATSLQHASTSVVDASRHPGGSLGVGLSTPILTYASLGADARIHLIAGESSIKSLGVTLKVRR